MTAGSAPDGVGRFEADRAASRPLAIQRVRVVDPSRGLDEVGTVLVAEGTILAAGAAAANQGFPAGAAVLDGSGLVAAPGLVDMRVFVGEPGEAHRETLSSASEAAARGGVTTFAVMPDTAPVIDDPALVDFLMRRARDTAIVRIHPIAALTKGLDGEELSEIGLLAEEGAVAFSNGRRAVRNARVMRRALTYARDFEALVCHHVEDGDLKGEGVVHEGENATRLGLKGIPAEAEHIMLDRDVRLAALTRARYHAEQVSSAGSIDILARARAEGRADVTAGVSIAHLTLNEVDVGSYRTFFKLSPPLRGEDDRTALVAALADGLIDIIVSSHDPQDVEMKRHPFAEAADGAIGLETMLAAGLRLVHSDDVTLTRLIEAMSTAPARRLRLPGGTLAPGAPADIVLFDPDRPWVLDGQALVSRSKNTAYDGARFSGRVVRTIVAGRTVFDLEADAGAGMGAAKGAGTPGGMVAAHRSRGARHA